MLDFGSCFRHDARMILELHSPLDMHLHLRDGDMLKLVAPLSSASFAGAVVMPNLVPPVADAERCRPTAAALWTPAAAMYSSPI